MLKKLQSKLGEVKENEPLAGFTTFKIGGPAKYFFVAKNSEELLNAVIAAEELKISYFILGWGSNLLVSDQGFEGLVIKNTSSNFEIKDDEITADSGLNLSRLVGASSQAGLTGLETLAGIPGTVGGAAFGNAGAYGVSLGRLVKEVKVYQNKQVKNFSQADMKYEYRESELKKNPGVILSVTVKLAKASQKEIQEKMIGIIKERNQKLPLEPSAGCVFKNIKLDQTKLDEKKIIKGLDVSQDDWQKATAHGKLSSAFIIDHLGLKGKKIGGCQISERHAAFFINIGEAKAEHVMMLISDVKMHARNQLGIQLQEEIRYLGF